MSLSFKFISIFLNTDTHTHTGRFKRCIAVGNGSLCVCVAYECVCERGNVACVVKRFFLCFSLLLNLPHFFTLQILSFLAQNNTQNVINVHFLMIHSKKCLQKNSKGQAVMCSVLFPGSISRAT